VIERRKHPRLSVMAQVQLTHDAEVHILEAANVSRGGLFLSGNPPDYPDLVAGADVDLVIFANNADELDAHASRARIARIEPETHEHQPAGFGLAFTAIDERNVTRLERLIEHVPKRSKTG